MKRVLVTRPEPGASATARTLETAGFAPVVMPLTQIVGLDPVPPDGQFDAVLATSANALRHAPARLLAAVKALPLFVVGSRAADEAPWRPAAVAPDAAALVTMVSRQAAPKSRLLYLAGRRRSLALEEGLVAAGHCVVPVEVYDAPAIRHAPGEIGTKLGIRPFSFALVYSRRGGELLNEIVAQRAGAAVLSAATFVCISREAGEPLVGGRLNVIFADMPDEQSMMRSLRGIAGC